MLSQQAIRSGYVSQDLRTLDELRELLKQEAPKVLIVDGDDSQAVDVMKLCRASANRTARIVALTTIPCLVRVGMAFREGASAVLARPTTFSQIIAVLDGTPKQDLEPMSLDRAIWEHLNQTLSETGSISAAARQLRLDRTSFKRMLRKRPF